MRAERAGRSATRRSSGCGVRRASGSRSAVVASGSGLDRVCTSGLVERSITADRLAEHLYDLVAQRGAPAVRRSENGPEFISAAMADWACTRTRLCCIPPGSPWHSGYVESFNSRLHDEFLNLNSFYPLLHALVVLSDWKDEYKHDRRHSSRG